MCVVAALSVLGYSLANNFTLTSVNSLLGYKENVHSSQPWIFVEDFPVVIQNESRTIKGI